MPLDDREVLLVDRAGLESAHQGPRGLGAAAAHQDPGGLAIQPVRGVGPERGPVLALQELHQRVVVVAGGGMDGEAGGLVQHQEARVEVQLDHVLRHLGLGLGAAAQGEGEAGVNAGARLERAVRHQAPLENALHPGPRQPADLLAEVPVQPPAGVVGLDGEGHVDETGIGHTRSLAGVGALAQRVDPVTAALVSPVR